MQMRASAGAPYCSLPGRVSGTCRKLRRRPESKSICAAEPLPQRWLVHLTGRVAWQRIHEADRARMLVARQIQLAVLIDLCLTQRTARLQHNDGAPHLA